MRAHRAVAIFGSSRTQPDSRQWIEAEKAGARCAGAGLTVVTGGYGGTMEAASRGAALAGGQVVGVTAGRLFLDREGANQYVTEEIPAATLAERLRILTVMVSGAIVFPGSIGTATELLLAWNLNHIARLSGQQRMPTVAVGWDQLWRLLSEVHQADPIDIHTVASSDEAVDWLLSQPEIC